jgi:hypothetical protein
MSGFERLDRLSPPRRASDQTSSVLATLIRSCGCRSRVRGFEESAATGAQRARARIYAAHITLSSGPPRIYMPGKLVQSRLDWSGSYAAFRI